MLLNCEGRCVLTRAYIPTALNESCWDGKFGILLTIRLDIAGSCHLDYSTIYYRSIRLYAKNWVITRTFRLLYQNIGLPTVDITEPTVDTIIDCRFVIFMRETAVIPRLFHLEMHPFIYWPLKREIHCYRWTFDYRKQFILRCKEPGIVGLFCP